MSSKQPTAMVPGDVVRTFLDFRFSGNSSTWASGLDLANFVFDQGFVRPGPGSPITLRVTPMENPVVKSASRFLTYPAFPED
jgi:hypothetical protein